MKSIRFLVDESCDFVVVRELRSSGYDVISVAESFPSATDLQVLRMAGEAGRILLTEDKDFGEWVFAHRERIAGVVFIRFPANARMTLGQNLNLLVREHGVELKNSFTVLEPGRARIRKINVQ